MAGDAHKMQTEMKIETAKATPAVLGTLFSAITLNEAVAVATLIYILMQIAYLGWKWHKESKNETP